MRVVPGNVLTLQRATTSFAIVSCIAMSPSHSSVASQSLQMDLGFAVNFAGFKAPLTNVEGCRAQMQVTNQARSLAKYGCLGHCATCKAGMLTLK